MTDPGQQASVLVNYRETIPTPELRLGFAGLQQPGSPVSPSRLNSGVPPASLKNGLDGRLPVLPFWVLLRKLLHPLPWGWVWGPVWAKGGCLRSAQSWAARLRRWWARASTHGPPPGRSLPHVGLQSLQEEVHHHGSTQGRHHARAQAPEEGQPGLRNAQEVHHDQPQPEAPQSGDPQECHPLHREPPGAAEGAGGELLQPARTELLGAHQPHLQLLWWHGKPQLQDPLSLTPVCVKILIPHLNQVQWDRCFKRRVHRKMQRKKKLV